MKTRLLTATFLILFTASATNALSSQTERKSLITAKRVIIGTALTIAATLLGYYYLMKPEMRMFARRHVRNSLGGAMALRQLNVPEQPPQDFGKAPMLLASLPVLTTTLEDRIAKAIEEEKAVKEESHPEKQTQNANGEAKVQSQQTLQEFEADLREAEELSLAFANSLEDQKQEAIAEHKESKEESKEPVAVETIVKEKEPAENAEKRKKKVRPCGYLLTNNLCVFMKMDDPIFQHTVNSAITINGQSYAPVNSHTDLTTLNSNHALIDPDEIIVINSETALILDVIYQEMLFLYREQYPSGSTQEQFFAFLIAFIRSHVFDASKPGSKSDAVADFIKTIFTDEDIIKLKTTNPARIIPVINLSQHLKARVGVCRHYSLVLVHLAQRFIKEQNSCLAGGSAHISAGRAAEEAHAWGVYVDSSGHAGLHVDALWDLNLNLDEQQPLDSSLLERLLTADRKQFLEDSVDFSQNNQIQNNDPQWGTQAGIYSFSVSDEEDVKEAAETPEWMKHSLDLDDSNFSS